MITRIETADDFRQHINTGEYCMVAFNASWCGPCKMMKPVLDRMSETYRTVKFFEVDVDELEDISAEAGVSAMPTYMIYSWGKVIDQLVGGSEVKFEALVKKYDGIPIPPNPQSEYVTVLDYVDRSDDKHYKQVRK